MKISTKIKKLQDETDNDLVSAVCHCILDNYSKDEEIKCFVNDLSRSGCVSGMVGELISYAQTEAFYIRFSGEIDELIDELEDSTGEATKFNSPKTNSMAWFGFEQTVYNINNQLEIVNF